MDGAIAQELLSHYLEAADERLQALASALAQARELPADVSSLEALRQVLHKTAGSAGTYGFPALTDSALLLEQQAVVARRAAEAGDAAGAAPAALFDAAESFHREMAAAFAEARRTLVVAQAAADARRSPEPAGPALSTARERLVVAVLGDAETDDSCAAAVGAALAVAGTHLLGAGCAGAARGFREAGGEGLVLWLVEGPRCAANRWTDLPLSAPSIEARCALAAATADGAIIIGGGAATLAQAGFLLQQGQPVVVIASSGGAAAMLAGRTLGPARVVAASSADEAVAELFTLLAASASAR